MNRHAIVVNQSETTSARLMLYRRTLAKMRAGAIDGLHIVTLNYCKPLQLFWFLCKWRYMNIRTAEQGCQVSGNEPYSPEIKETAR